MGSLLVSFLPSQKIIAPFDSSYDNIMKSGWKIGIVLEPDKPPSIDRSNTIGGSFPFYCSKLVKKTVAALFVEQRDIRERGRAKKDRDKPMMKSSETTTIGITMTPASVPPPNDRSLVVPGSSCSSLFSSFFYFRPSRKKLRSIKAIFRERCI